MTATDLFDPFAGAEVISLYTRKQAIEDGVLIEVSEEARRRAQCFLPVAITAALHAECVAWPNDVPVPEGNDETTREEYLLGRLGVACMQSEYVERGENGYTLKLPEGQGGFTLMFRHRYITPDGQQVNGRFKAVLGGDDDCKACWTLMLPEED